MPSGFGFSATNYLIPDEVKFNGEVAGSQESDSTVRITEVHRAALAPCRKLLLVFQPRVGWYDLLESYSNLSSRPLSLSVVPILAPYRPAYSRGCLKADP
jgi:hypothetical protein